MKRIDFSLRVHSRLHTALHGGRDEGLKGPKRERERKK